MSGTGVQKYGQAWFFDISTEIHKEVPGEHKEREIHEDFYSRAMESDTTPADMLLQGILRALLIEMNNKDNPEDLTDE